MDFAQRMEELRLLNPEEKLSVKFTLCSRGELRMRGNIIGMQILAHDEELSYR